MARMGIQPGNVVHGIGTVGATAQVIASDSTSSVLVWMDSANSGTIYFGGSAVTTADGYPRTAGQEFEGGVFANQTYVIGSGAGQVYRWIGIKL